MEKCKWTVEGMVKKFNGKDYVEAEFPANMAELKACKVIQIIADTGEKTDFEYTEEKKIANNKRGFGLMFQSSTALMTEEEKAANKEKAKAQRDKIKAILAKLAASGKSIDELLGG